MSVGAPDGYLSHYLEPLAKALAREGVTDIYLNRPGEVWVETLGGGLERFERPELDAQYLWRLARQVASHGHQGISRSAPLVAATLPNGARVQIVAPPATRAGMAIAIRRHVSQNLPLAGFVAEAEMRSKSAEEDDRLKRLHRASDHVAFLAEAVRKRLNIVISGGTATGKTTLLSTLLEYIPPEERLIFIEDAPELRIRHANSVGLVATRGGAGEAQVSSEDLLQAALRMRPDRIILGELRGPEAFTFLRAINTGHPGSLTTIHADSAERAFVQLAMMAMQAKLGITYLDLLQIIRSMVDVVVQLERQGQSRRISEVYFRGG